MTNCWEFLQCNKLIYFFCFIQIDLQVSVFVMEFCFLNHNLIRSGKFQFWAMSVVPCSRKQRKPLVGVKPLSNRQSSDYEHANHGALSSLSFIFQSTQLYRSQTHCCGESICLIRHSNLNSRSPFCLIRHSNLNSRSPFWILVSGLECVIENIVSFI